MARALSFLVLASLLLWAVCSPVSADHSRGREKLVIQAGQVIDGTGRVPKLDAVILVEGEQIKASGRRVWLCYNRPF
jgi:hypothetical protein